MSAVPDRISELEAEIARLNRLLVETGADTAQTAAFHQSRAADLAASRAEMAGVRDELRLSSLAASARATRLTDRIAEGDAANVRLTVANADLIETNAFLASVLSSSADCIKVLDLDGRLIFMSEGGMRVMEISDFDAVAGCAWPDFWVGDGAEMAREALAMAKAGGVGRFEGPTPTYRGTPKYWNVVVTAIPGDDGAPRQILAISRDVTDMRAAHDALAQGETMLRSVADAMPALIGYVDKSHRFGFANRAYERLLKRPRSEIIGRTVEELFGDDRFASQMPLLERALAGENVREQTKTVRSNGSARWTDTRLVPRRGPTGDVLGVYALVIDVTELKQGEEQRQLLTRELSHRVKNSLATVTAIANQTFRAPASMEDAAATFSARLGALAQAHDLLTQSNFAGASIRSVIDDALKPHRPGGGRFSLAGPDIQLSSRRALALALGMHELATNAAKYGALSNDAGRVGIDWRVDASGDAPLFRLTWRESGGPLVITPSRRGFGSRLIGRSLAGDWEGEAKVHYEPTGVVFELTAPLRGALG